MGRVELLLKLAAKLRVLVFTAILGCTQNALAASGTQTEVRIGVFAYRGVSETVERWTPFADSMSRRLVSDALATLRLATAKYGHHQGRDLR